MDHGFHANLPSECHNVNEFLLALSIFVDQIGWNLIQSTTQCVSFNKNRGIESHALYKGVNEILLVLIFRL